MRRLAGDPAEVGGRRGQRHRSVIGEVLKRTGTSRFWKSGSGGIVPGPPETASLVVGRWIEAVESLGKVGRVVRRLIHRSNTLWLGHDSASFLI